MPSAVPCCEARGSGTGRSNAEHDPVARESVGTSGGGGLRCAVCGAPIAHRSAAFQMSGQGGSIVCANPHGRVFEILTLRSAHGLFAMGAATTEHTWFPGYAWQVVCCMQCGTHLGWRFSHQSSGAVPPFFFGLIVSALVEDD